MRLRTSMSVAFCIFAAGLGAAGCSSGNSSSSASSSASGSATTSPAVPPSTAAEAGTGTPTPAATQQSQAVAGNGVCQAANLSFTLGAKIASTASTQPTQVVDLTNKGTSACSLEGFPGVNLVGVANGQQNYTWPLTRASASYASQSGQGIAKVTLQPGGTAHFDLLYLPGTAGDGSTLISVSHLVITPPNDYGNGQLTWNQSIVLQDAATHPGTYIMPVVAGS
jgi:hypothetical protein